MVNFIGEEKHTKGPWVLDGHNLSTVLHCDAQKGSPNAKHICGDYTVIARCEGENWKENARLVAASPALLQAAETVLAVWSDLVQNLPQDDKIEEVEFNAFMQLRSAIAMALDIPSWEVHKHISSRASSGQLKVQDKEQQELVKW